jgi:hypothetical protein
MIFHGLILLIEARLPPNTDSSPFLLPAILGRLAEFSEDTTMVRVT